MTTMMIMTVIDVFALLPDLIECKYLRPPIADACALVVNTQQQQNSMLVCILLREYVNAAHTFHAKEGCSTISPSHDSSRN